MLGLAHLIAAVHANDLLCNNLRHSEVIMAFILDTLTALIY